MSTNRNELDAHIAHAIQDMAKALGRAVVDGRRTCVHCDHFDPSIEHCALVNQRPPARVIAFGCDRFEDSVPF